MIHARFGRKVRCDPITPSSDADSVELLCGRLDGFLLARSDVHMRSRGHKLARNHLSNSCSSRVRRATSEGRGAGAGRGREKRGAERRGSSEKRGERSRNGQNYRANRLDENSPLPPPVTSTTLPVTSKSISNEAVKKELQTRNISTADRRSIPCSNFCFPRCWSTPLSARRTRKLFGSRRERL